MQMNIMNQSKIKLKKKLYKIHQKDRTSMKIYEPNHTVPKYINQQLTEM